MIQKNLSLKIKVGSNPTYASTYSITNNFSNNSWYIFKDNQAHKEQHNRHKPTLTPTAIFSETDYKITVFTMFKYTRLITSATNNVTSCLKKQ